MLTSGFLHARIISAPWLQAVTPHAVTVSVECDAPDSVTVIYGNGTDPDQMANLIIVTTARGEPATWVHVISLKGLKPMTRYHYSVQQGESDSGLFEFFTAVEPGNPFRAIWMADFPDKRPESAPVFSWLKLASPMVMFYGRRFTPSPGCSDKHEELLFQEMSYFHSGVPFFSAIPPVSFENAGNGNFIHYPEADRDSVSFYAVDYGDLHVLYLDSRLPLDSASIQYQFVREDIIKCRQRWKMVISDLPAGCPDCPEDRDFSRLIREVLEPNGVDFILSSFPHRYHHHQVHGIHCIVAGPWGTVLPSNTERIEGEVIQSGKPLFLIIDVAPSRIKIFVQNEHNQQMDMIDRWK